MALVPAVRILGTDSTWREVIIQSTDTSDRGVVPQGAERAKRSDPRSEPTEFSMNLGETWEIGAFSAKRTHYTSLMRVIFRAFPSWIWAT